MRWFVLISLLYAIYRAYTGYRNKAVFTKTDNAVRHWTATIAHMQLIVGVILYMQSPLTKYFWANPGAATQQIDTVFFGLIHITLMITAITILIIGSALVKRNEKDQEKFKTMLTWFSLTLLIIFIAIPWPFSPLANRPYIRPF